jgi:hypothetical protein
MDHRLTIFCEFIQKAVFAKAYLNMGDIYYAYHTVREKVTYIYVYPYGVSGDSSLRKEFLECQAVDATLKSTNAEVLRRSRGNAACTWDDVGRRSN